MAKGLSHLMTTVLTIGEGVTNFNAFAGGDPLMTGWVIEALYVTT